MILFNDKVQGDLGKLLDMTFKKGVMGQSNQFIYNIDVYLKNDMTGLQLYKAEGLRAVLNVTSKGKKAITDTSKLSDVYLAIFGMLEHHTFVGIDMTKEGYPASLYTRNILMLKQMQAAGYIVPDADLSKIEKDLKENKTALGFDEGSYVVVRLDVAAVTKSRVQFKPVIPRSRVKIGIGQDYVFIPIDFMHRAAAILDSASKGIFKFTKTSVTGTKTHVATSNPDIVRDVYKNAPKNLVESRIRKITCGYDDVTLRYICYDLESSMYALGVASFRPEMLDVIKKGSLKTVDTSMHSVNYDYLQGIFKTRVKGMRLADFDKFKVIDTSSIPTVDKKAEAIINMSEEWDVRDLFTIMKSYPEIFGDIDKSLASREKNAPKVLKQLESVDNFDIDTVRDLLKTGVVKITAISKANKTYERYASNNEAVLKRFLGKDYVKKYESSSNRIKAMKKEVEEGNIRDRATLEKLLVEYDLMALVDSRSLVTNNPVDVLEMSLNNVRDVPSLPNDTIIYRKLNANSRDSFYGQVKGRNIIAIEYAPMATK